MVSTLPPTASMEHSRKAVVRDWEIETSRNIATLPFARRESRKAVVRDWAIETKLSPLTPVSCRGRKAVVRDWAIETFLSSRYSIRRKGCRKEAVRDWAIETIQAAPEMQDWAE